MADRLRLSSLIRNHPVWPHRVLTLIPAGLVVERSTEVEGILVVSARAMVDERACPLSPSGRRDHCRKVSGKLRPFRRRSFTA